MTDGPQITRGPDTVVVIEGSNATLLCGEDLQTNPQATVVWSDNTGNTVYDGVAPDNTPAAAATTVDPRISVANTLESVRLSLRGLTEQDAGNWVCTLQNGARALVVNIQLVVLGKRIQTNSRHACIFREGNSITRVLSLYTVDHS